jgi:dienelactone hydrolase
MPQDARGREEFIRDTYLAGISASGRKDLFFLQRYWGGDPPLTQELVARNSPVPMFVSIKFNGEHMYSSPRPHFFDRRWVDQEPRDYGVIWHLRNDDLFTLRWGDPEFVRATIGNCAASGAGFLTGSEIWIDGADYIHGDDAKSHVNWKWDFDRLWLRYQLWGRLGYDPATPDRVFEDLIAAHFGRELAPKVLQATAAASRLHPRLTSFHWNYMNGDWYPEGCVGSWVTGKEFGRGKNLRLNDTIFHDVLEFIFNQTVEDTMESIPGFVGRKVHDTPAVAGRATPLDVATQIDADAAIAQKLADELAAKNPKNELLCWTLDLKTQAALARYYAAKIRGATHLALHFAGQDGEQAAAVAELEQALARWKELAALGDAHYKEHEVWLMGPFSWGRYEKAVARDVEIARTARSDPEGVRKSRAFAAVCDTNLDFGEIVGELDLGVGPFVQPPPLRVEESTLYVEAEDFTGPWREQANYPNFRGKGFRCSTVLGSVATTSIRRRVEVAFAGRYSLWVRGLVGHASDQHADRSVVAAIDGQLLSPTQTALGVAAAFTWEKAGEVELGAGLHTIEIRDHGPGFEHCDAVALSRDPKFDPGPACTLPPIVPDGGERFAAALAALVHEQIAAIPPVPADAAECRARLESTRRAFLEAVGLATLPERTPLNVRTIGTIDGGEYAVDRIVFESRPGFLVPAHVWHPKSGGRFPGVAVPVGHWMVEGKMAAPMQGLGQALARRGYVALIYDPIDEGERRVAGMSHRLALPLMVAGQCDLTYLLWDTVRALDVLEARPDVDKTKLAVTGCSGGGMNTLYISFVDARVKAAAASCYLSTYEAILAAGNHCEDNYVPGILKQGELPDVVAIAAPRPLISLSATHDEIFPVAPTRAAVARIRGWYEKLGAQSPVELFFDESPHDYSKPMREHCLAFFEKSLRGRADAGEAIAETWTTRLVPHDDPAWRCMSGAWPKEARSLESFARSAIDEALTRRAQQPLSAAEVAKQARELLAWHEARARITSRGERQVHDLSVEPLALDVDGFPATAVLLRAGGGGSAPAKVTQLDVLVDDRGLHSILQSDWSALVAQVAPGHALLLVDPRGRGDTAGDEEHAWRVAVYLGRPLLGMRALDFAAAARAVAAKLELADSAIVLHGRGVESGLLALLTSLSSGLALGRCEGTMNSLREVVDRHGPNPAICVPRLAELGDVAALRAAAPVTPALR